VLLTVKASARKPKEDKDKVAKKPDEGETKLEGGNQITNSVGMKLVLIPKGTFKMGSPTDEEGRNGWEDQHDVEISKPFYMGVYTVTQKQYHEVMGTNPSWFSKDGGGKKKVKDLDTDDFPVEQVSWEEADKFCKKLSALAGERKASPAQPAAGNGDFQDDDVLGALGPRRGLFLGVLGGRGVGWRRTPAGAQRGRSGPAGREEVQR
jgi:formylglycine-generating enzyme required for sulfatase activity